jgi:tRNA(Ile)-lysidine synthase
MAKGGRGPYYEISNDMLEERVAEIITRYSMFAPGSRIGVAVSGGADSVVLLHLLHRLQGRFGFTPVVLHVNHALRGAESNRDEEFVRELARSLGLAFVSERIPPAPGNIEQEARRARRAFCEAMRLSQGLSRVALGHTRSDQAETVLLRLFRGAGLSGLAGMRFMANSFVVRPLLSTSRQEVRDWAKAERLPWREDSSNLDGRFARNRLRRETLPGLARRFNPNIEGVLASTAELAQGEEDDWADRVEEAYRALVQPSRLGLILQVAELTLLSTAMQRRLLRRILKELLPNELRGLDFEHVEAIRALICSREGHARAMLPGAEAIRSYGTLLVMLAGRLASEPRNYEVALVKNSWNELPYGAGQIYVGDVKPSTRLYASFKEDQAIASEWVELGFESSGSEIRVVARNWQPGDRLLRPDHKSAEKVKTLFGEHRILLWERRHWPVVVYEGQIAWVRGFGVAQHFSPGEPAGQKISLLYLPER